MSVSIILTAFVTAMAVLDILYFRIPNAFLAAALLCAAAFRLQSEGTAAVPDMLLGALIPFALCFLLFFFSMMGAGDIKLLMVIGAYAGSAKICGVMFTALLLAGAIAAFKILRHRMAAFRGFYLTDYLQSLWLYYSGGKRRLKGRSVTPYIGSDEIAGRKPWLMHLSVPIAAAVIIRLVILR